MDENYGNFHRFHYAILLCKSDSKSSSFLEIVLSCRATFFSIIRFPEKIHLTEKWNLLRWGFGFMMLWHCLPSLLINLDLKMIWKTLWIHLFQRLIHSNLDLSTLLVTGKLALKSRFALKFTVDILAFVFAILSISTLMSLKWVKLNLD